MKKLLGIVVLGLLLSGNAYAGKVVVYHKDENGISLKFKTFPGSNRKITANTVPSIKNLHIILVVIQVQASMEGDCIIVAQEIYLKVLYQERVFVGQTMMRIMNLHKSKRKIKNLQRSNNTKLLAQC